MTYHNEGVVASYPYTFDVDENGIGTVIAFVYDKLQVTNKQELLDKLATLDTQTNACYTLQDDKVIYQASAPVSTYKDIEHAEVGIRRNFIEDFIETDEELREIVTPYHAHTLKTEFVIE